jgi:hypothetical protein
MPLTDQGKPAAGNDAMHVVLASCFPPIRRAPETGTWDKWRLRREL